MASPTNQVFRIGFSSPNQVTGSDDFPQPGSDDSNGPVVTIDSLCRRGLASPPPSRDVVAIEEDLTLLPGSGTISTT
ncbi:hypothetical protein LINPERHAP1_LOCUS13162, partial [Linum perenne]